MSAILADRLQVWGTEDDFIIFSDGSIGFGFDLVSVDISCWDDDRVNSLSDQLGQFLNGLPSNIDLQFIQSIQGGNSEVLEAHRKLVTSEPNETAKKLCEDRVNYLQDLDNEGFLPRHGLSLLVRRPMHGPLIKKPRFLSKAKLFQKVADHKLAHEIAETQRLRADLLQSLSAAGLAAKIISEREVIERLYRAWNPTRPVELGRYDTEDIRGSVLFTDASLSAKGFSLADMHYRVLSLKMMPDQSFAGMAASLRSLPFDSQLLLTVHVPDQQSELESIQTQRRLAFSMVQGKVGVRDIDSEAKLDDLETLLEEMVSQGEKVFHVSLNVILRSTDKDELDAQVSGVLMKMRELGGAEAMEESLAAFDIYCESAFPNARAKERAKRMKTSNLADFLPVYGPWTGHESARVLLRSRMGNLLKFDPFSSDLTNANQLVSGGSGAGKSFLANTMLLQMLKESPRTYVVDVGGSYKKLIEALGGQYIPLGVGSGLAINPFDLKEGQIQPDDGKLKFLTSLVEIMTKEEDSQRLPRLERAEVERAIQESYQTGGLPQLSNVREILAKHEDPKLRSLARILGPWCGGTPFGQFVDRPTNVTLQSRIVCFDLKGLETYPDLQAVCLFIITDLVWRVVQADRSTKKFLVLDECWKLLENDAGATFIAEVFRTFRKYYASAIAISQTIDDFARSKVANAILPNSSIKWIMKQKGADMESLKEILALNDNEIHAVTTLHQERGKYSEAFLMAGDNRAIAVVESIPLEYWICTTDPRDLAAIDDYATKNPDKSQLEVFEHLAALYPHGVAMLS